MCLCAAGPYAAQMNRPAGSSYPSLQPAYHSPAPPQHYPQVPPHITLSSTVAAVTLNKACVLCPAVCRRRSAEPVSGGHEPAVAAARGPACGQPAAGAQPPPRQTRDAARPLPAAGPAEAQLLPRVSVRRSALLQVCVVASLTSCVSSAGSSAAL